MRACFPGARPGPRGSPPRPRLWPTTAGGARQGGASGHREAPGPVAGRAASCVRGAQGAGHCVETLLPQPGGTEFHSAFLPWGG